MDDRDLAKVDEAFDRLVDSIIRSTNIQSLTVVEHVRSDILAILSGEWDREDEPEPLAHVVVCAEDGEVLPW